PESIQSPRSRSGWQPPRSAPRERVRTVRVLYAGGAVAATAATCLVDLEATTAQGRDCVLTDRGAGNRPACRWLGAARDIRAEKHRARLVYRRACAASLRGPHGNADQRRNQHRPG